MGNPVFSIFMREEEESETYLDPTIRSLAFVFGIPILWIVMYAFSKRKRAFCIQKYGPEACQQPVFSHIVLGISLLVCLYAIFRAKARKIMNDVTEKKEKAK